jgi:lysylphosphatidylglycerol synthetase-like protein (DUF2156 family)
MTENLINERLLIESWIHQWGGFAAEFVLEPSTFIFRAPNIDGLVVYRIESDCAIAFGDPICAMGDVNQLAQAFHDYCRERNMNIIHIIASEQFAKWAIINLCNILIEVGEELVFNPQNDPTKGHRSYKLRNYIHHAQHLGLTVHEYLPYDVNLENSIDQVGVAWLKGRRGPQIYLGNLNFFEHRKNKRWFYVQYQEKIIAVALLSELKNESWLLKYVISVPDSPRGTTELLVDSIFQKLRCENYSFLTYGVVPAERLGEIVGLSKFSSWMARFVFRIIKRVFQVDSRKTYWQKFHPKTAPSYVLFSHSKIGLKEIRAMTKALNMQF